MILNHIDSIDSIDEKAYHDLKTWQEQQLAKGIRAHGKHISCRDCDRDEVKMYRYTVLKKVMELKSEAFDTEDAARHFMDCFNDSFILRASIVAEEGRYYVYSGWMPISGFTSYFLNAGQEGLYFVFPNWS